MYPYKTKTALAEALGISRSTVYDRMREIDGNDRYGPYTVIHDGQIVLINTLAFLDWMKYRRQLMDKNLRKYVPEYNPKAIAAAMGWEPVYVNLRKPKEIA